MADEFLPEESALPEGLDEFIAAPTLAPLQQAVAPQPTSVAQNVDISSPRIENSDIPVGLDEFIEPELKEDKYGTLGQQAITALEGIAEGVAGPLAPGIERALGVKPEDIRAREEVNPASKAVGELIGLGGSAVSGVGLGSAILRAGEAANVASGAIKLGKVGSAVVRGAIENAVFQGSDEISKLVLSDPNQSAETALTDMGLASAIGGAFGLGGVAASSLWKAAKGANTTQILGSLTKKLGGIENVVDDSIESAIAKTGIDIAPEVKAGLSNDPYIQNMFKTLEQSDITTSGRKLQESYTKFRKDAGDAIIGALGRTPDEVDALASLSKYEAGRELGKVLAKEYSEQLSPIVKQFDELKGKYKNVELTPDMQVPGAATIPGTSSEAIERIAKLAQEEGWAASPSSDIMKEVNRVMQELPLQKNIKNLGDYITQVGNNMMSDPLNGPMRRAGHLISQILKDAEASVIERHLLTEGGGKEAVQSFKAARQAYKAQSELKEALDSRLHTRSSTSSFAKALKELADTDGETILRRLSGTNDADLLQFLSKNYPETAKLVKNYQINELLKTASDKAKPGLNINSEALLKNLNKMSPEMRNFIASPEALTKINAVAQVIEKFNALPHNFSNTARTLDKLLQYVPGSAVGLATGLLSGSPLSGVLIGALTKTLGKDIPDAVRLGLLKFLGSAQKVDAAGFQSMVQQIAHTIKGEQMATKAVKNIFKEGKDEVVPKPKERDLKLLDRSIKELQQLPEKALDIGKKAAYYMPEYNTALSQSVMVASQFLNNQRPDNQSKAPLDSPMPVDPAKTREYQNLLSLAQQPLLVLDKIKKGTLTSGDINAIQTMYPQLYARLSNKLMNEAAEIVSKGKLIPYRTKMSLSLFLGQPLDSTLSPDAIIAASQRGNQPEQPMPPNNRGPQGAPSRLQNSKLPNTYRTQSQAREARSIENN